jgi:hypothetical protein
MSYFNTTGQSGSRLKEYKTIAEAQQVLVERFFSRHSGWFTTYEVFITIFDGKIPYTSAQRCISNLYARGFLEKSESADAIGMWGRPVHRWRRKRGQGDLFNE